MDKNHWMKRSFHLNVSLQFLFLPIKLSVDEKIDCTKIRNANFTASSFSNAVGFNNNSSTLALSMTYFKCKKTMVVKGLKCQFSHLTNFGNKLNIL